MVNINIISSPESLCSTPDFVRHTYTVFNDSFIADRTSEKENRLNVDHTDKRCQHPLSVSCRECFVSQSNGMHVINSNE